VIAPWAAAKRAFEVFVSELPLRAGLAAARAAVLRGLQRIYDEIAQAISTEMGADHLARQGLADPHRRGPHQRDDRILKKSLNSRRCGHDPAGAGRWVFAPVITP